MGWFFRKSFRIAPGIRLNLSKSGVGVSMGVKGFRVSTGPRGSYVNMGMGGVYYRQKIGGSPRSGAPSQGPLAIPDGAAATAGGMIPTASVGDLVDASSAHVLSVINQRLHQPAYLRVTLAAGCVATALLSLIHWIMVPLVGGFTVYLAWLTSKMDDERRSSSLCFQFDRELAQRWQALNVGIRSLAGVAGVWQIEGIDRSFDLKRSAGASFLCRRNAVQVATRSPMWIQTNVTPYSIGLGCQTIFFMPDRLYVWQNGTYGAVDYKALDVQFHGTRFTETELLPSDATVIGYTWLHPNKDGSRDCRFATNRQVPIVQYGDLLLRSTTGLYLRFHTSTVDAARICGAALRTWSHLPPVQAV